MHIQTIWWEFRHLVDQAELMIEDLEWISIIARRRTSNSVLLLIWPIPSTLPSFLLIPFLNTYPSWNKHTQSGLILKINSVWRFVSKVIICKIRSYFFKISFCKFLFCISLTQFICRPFAERFGSSILFFLSPSICHTRFRGNIF